MSTKMLVEMRDLMRWRHYSIHAERVYCHWVTRYVHFHNMQARDDLPDRERKIEARLTHLARDLQVASSTRIQVMNALVFLYKHLLKQPLSGGIDAHRARRRARIPVVLTREDTARVDRIDVRSAPARRQASVRVGLAHHGMPPDPGPGPGPGPGDEGPHVLHPTSCSMLATESQAHWMTSRTNVDPFQSRSS